MAAEEGSPIADPSVSALEARMEAEGGDAEEDLECIGRGSIRKTLLSLADAQFKNLYNTAHAWESDQYMRYGGGPPKSYTGFNVRARMMASVKKLSASAREYLSTRQADGLELADRENPIRGIVDRKVGTLAAAAQAGRRAEPATDEAYRQTCEFMAGNHPSLGWKVGGDQDPLTADEAGAIWMYCLNTDFYRTLNASLRDSDPNNDKPFWPYLALFRAALQKLAAANRIQEQLQGSEFGGYLELWRGMSRGVKDISEKYRKKKGKNIVWWNVSSCSKSYAVSAKFAGTGGTMFRILAATPVPIQNYSKFAGEEEWIVFCGTVFTVVEIEDKSGMTFITLRECPELAMVT